MPHKATIYAKEKVLHYLAENLFFCTAKTTGKRFLGYHNLHSAQKKDEKSVFCIHTEFGVDQCGFS